MDLIIRGGQVVTPIGAGQMDVGVQGEHIAVVASAGSLDVEAQRIIDATGKIVLPGGIEPHTHIGIPVPEMWAGRPEVFTQPPEAASRAAAYGGGHHVHRLRWQSSYHPRRGTVPLAYHEAVGATPPGIRRPLLHGLHFSLHPGWRRAGNMIGELGEAIQAGISSFKIFTTFNARCSYGHLWDIFQEVSRHGGIMAVHAEEDDIVTYMERKLHREGNDQGHNLHLVHDNISEDIAFRKIIRLAQHTETGIYFVHTTAKEGVAAVAEARLQQQPVYGEALHNYLEFTCDDYKKPEGTIIHTCPAIKYAEDRDALQQGLVDGPMCTTATDDYTTSKAVKLSGDTIFTVCG